FRASRLHGRDRIRQTAPFRWRNHREKPQQIQYVQTRKTQENEQLYMPIKHSKVKDGRADRAGEAEIVEQMQENEANQPSARPQNEIRPVRQPGR
ncbi:hypothetical protein, partial [Phyllobacterium calauticae]|uniref:hypothetical protein n=1 Tax=Phyllobacterium calauticae TaxID=2817027 RepID=UPI001CBAA242